MKNNPCVNQSPSEKLDRAAARLCLFSICSSLCSPLMSQNLTSPLLASLGFPPCVFSVFNLLIQSGTPDSQSCFAFHLRSELLVLTFLTHVITQIGEE